MKEGSITKHDLERIIRAVEHDMELHPIEKPEVIVQDKDSDTDEGHVVNIDKLNCTCSDMQYNCSDGQYCKHIFYAVFKKHRML